MKLLLIWLGVLLCSPITGYALDHSQFGSVFVGSGVISQYSKRTAANSTGGTTLLATNALDLLVQGRFALGSTGWGWSPTFSLTPISKSGANAGETSRLMTLDLRALWEPGSGFDLHFGPGLLFQTLSGSGGTVVLNNGTSTSTFGLPSGSVTTRIFYFDLGLGFQIVEWIRLDLDALVSGILSSRRAVSPTLNLSMRVL